MANWREYRLSDFIDINPKVTLKSSNQYSFVEMKDLNENQKYVLPSQTRDLKGGARFGNRDTLFARITPCLQNGKICQVKGLRDDVGFGSTEFLVFRGKEGISNTDFIYYLSRFYVVRKFAEQNMVGTSGRQRVAKEAFENIELNLPDLDTQISIAEILSSLDDKIELNNQINKNLEALAQALFKQWFVDFEFPISAEQAASMGKPNENGQPYKSSGGEMVESELGEIPKEWSVGKLIDLFQLQRGHDLPVNNRIPGTAPVYSASGIHGYHNEVKAKAPGITTGRSGVIGKVFLILEDYWPLNTSLYVKEFKVASPYYTYFILKEVDLLSLNAGSAVPTLNRNEVHSLPCIIPLVELIREFTSLVKDNFDAIKINKDEIETLVQLRDHLLPKLIAGELEVQNV